MELYKSEFDYLNNVLNRSKLIIDEFNDYLVNNNEYGHINIINDVDKSLIKLNNLKLKSEIMDLFCLNFNNQDKCLLVYHIEYIEDNDKMINNIKNVLSNISLLSKYDINIKLNNSDIFNGNSFNITLTKKEI